MKSGKLEGASEEGKIGLPLLRFLFALSARTKQ